MLIEEIVSSIGSKISELRKQKDFSLHQLAEKAGVSPTTIHKLERNEMTPTVTILMKIADALGEKVSFFLGEESDETHYVEQVEYVAQKNGRIFKNNSGNTQIKYLAFRLKEGKLLSLLTHIKAGTKSGNKPQSHPGEEFVYCLEGEIKYEVNGKEFTLKKGDSLHFFASLPHRWEVTGEEGTKNLWIITPPPVGAVTELWR